MGMGPSMYTQHTTHHLMCVCGPAGARNAVTTHRAVGIWGLIQILHTSCQSVTQGWCRPSRCTLGVAIPGRGHLMYSSLPAKSSSHECLAAPAGHDWFPTGGGGRGRGERGRRGGRDEGGWVKGSGRGETQRGEGEQGE